MEELKTLVSTMINVCFRRCGRPLLVKSGAGSMGSGGREGASQRGTRISGY